MRLLSSFLKMKALSRVVRSRPVQNAINSVKARFRGRSRTTASGGRTSSPEQRRGGRTTPPSPPSQPHV